MRYLDSCHRQIEIVVIGPPKRLPTTTALSLLPFSSVISINNDTTSYPCEIQSKSCRMRRRWWDRMSPRSFKSDDFWEEGDGEEEEGRKWKGWRRRRRRRRRYPEKWTYLDSFFIFKILRPYGWSLPVILLSWLAASGPKAFFISLVLFFALSAAALVVQLLWPGGEFDSQGSGSKRKRRSAGRVSRSGMAGGRNGEMRSGQKHASAYDSWLDLGLDESSFGGWVELEEERFSDDTGQRKGKIESSKGSRESLREVGSEAEAEAEAEAPLLLRLLVAMFPFMASWTKLFW